MNAAKIICSGWWREVQSGAPWVKSFNKHMRRLSLPRLAGSEVVVATDSSGLHKQCPFEVMGVLIADFDSSKEWEIGRRVAVSI